jgi:general L-amino acid transport system substrate-binding protein
LRKYKTALLSIGLLLGPLVGTAQAGTLENIQQRGHLNCGVSTSQPGFSITNAEGRWTGFDVDFCRAIAAAIFDDPEKVKFTPLTAAQRFTALQSGEIDVLSRTTTWTMSRDISIGIIFTDINYYDGQAFMVAKKLNINSIGALNGASICVSQGTTTELNVADYFRAHNMKYDIIAYSTPAEAIAAYESGRCDAFTTENAGLYGARLQLSKPDDHVILPGIISREPFAPAVRRGDSGWFDVVRWVGYALVNAEILSVSQSNVTAMEKTDNPEIKRLLGIEGKFGESIGISNGWVKRIVTKVGNYGDIYSRNLGENSAKLNIPRGLNALWSNGGLQYAPPIR